ncbi:MAG: FAD binding domain-containing protein [bacterium]|nr:FAD binding domain-containing protein [Candidatus Sumerlaeota bacterium]
MSIRRYERPLTVKAAVDFLINEEGCATVLAGGTDLIADVRAGREAGLVVDIKHIPELNEIRWEKDGALILGSCVIVQRIAGDAAIRGRYRALSDAAENLGSYQVRCRATIAGNLGNASPCADNAPALLVLNAQVRVASPQGCRETALNGFIRDVKQTVLKRGEIITALIIPPRPPRLRSAFYKIKRVRGHDMALVNAAGAYDPDNREFSLAIGSAACTPVLVRGLEGICPPGSAADAVGDRLAERALADISPIDDVRASAQYRRDMTALLCRRLARTLMEADGPPANGIMQTGGAGG